jgi:uncharacterized membrane protein YciS (DUF1049 family)
MTQRFIWDINLHVCAVFVYQLGSAEQELYHMFAYVFIFILIITYLITPSQNITTPLHMAAFSNKVELAKVHLNTGADLSTVDKVSYDIGIT